MTSTKVLKGDRCQCSACSEYFNSTFAFDKHRRGKHGVSRHCLTPNAMLEAGMAINKAGFWISAPHDRLEKVR
jgi:hypothetical protein